MPSNFAAIPIEALLAQLTWAIPAIAAVLALKALLPRLLGRAGEARVGARLKRLLPEVRDDLILPDGRGGLTQIDHLALTPAGLLVVETKTYSGLILGQAHEPTWTQVIGRRRHRFQNPLRQNFAHVRAIEALLPDIPVEGRVVFAGQARFANGMPEGVCHAADLADELRSLRQGQPSPVLRDAWARVLAAARTDRAARREHLRGLQARHGGVRSAWVPILVFTLSMAWLVGQWVHQRPMSRWLEASTAAIQHTRSAAAATQSILAPLSPSTTPQRQSVPALPRTAAPLSGEGHPSRPSNPAERVATIEWATPQTPRSVDEACALATAAVLIENTAENRRSRDRACGPSSPR